MWKLNALQTRIYRRQIWNATRHDQFFIESDWFATIDRFVESRHRGRCFFTDLMRLGWLEDRL